VALSTRDAAGSRAGGVPVTTGYITPPLLSRRSPRSKARLAASRFRRFAMVGSGVVRGTALEKFVVTAHAKRNGERGDNTRVRWTGNRSPEEGKLRKQGRGPPAVGLSTSGSATRVDDVRVRDPRGSEEALLGRWDGRNCTKG
jgi:hypothetical protein